MFLFVMALIFAVVALVGFFLMTRKARLMEVPEVPKGASYQQERKAEKIVEANEEAEESAHTVRVVGRFLALGGLILAIGLGLVSTIYSQSVGQAKVILNPGGSIAGHDSTPGFGMKAPWQRVVNFDLFAQEAVYAGTGDGAPDYTGGEVNGQEVTASVKGGAQTNYDLMVSYNLDGEKVSDIYKTYRDQERLTRQVIAPKILEAARDIPSPYAPVEFRGEKRGEATKALQDRLNKDLKPFGIEVTQVTIQSIRFTEDVENSIKAVEVAQQNEAKAEAELRATEVSAQAQVVEAQAEADANRLLEESLTPGVLESKRLDTLKAIGDKGNLVIVPEGSTPFVNVQPQAAE